MNDERIALHSRLDAAKALVREERGDDADQMDYVVKMPAPVSSLSEWFMLHDPDNQAFLQSGAFKKDLAEFKSAQATKPGRTLRHGLMTQRTNQMSNDGFRITIDRRGGHYFFCFTDLGELHESKRGYYSISAAAQEAEQYIRQMKLGRHFAKQREARAAGTG